MLLGVRPRRLGLLLKGEEQATCPLELGRPDPQPQQNGGDGQWTGSTARPNPSTMHNSPARKTPTGHAWAAPGLERMRSRQLPFSTGVAAPSPSVPSGLPASRRVTSGCEGLMGGSGAW